jgi:hypothetical protein
MWPWVTYSKRRRGLVWAWVLGGLVIAARPDEVRVPSPVEDALAVYFPAAEIRREAVFLTEPQIDEAQKRAGTRPASAVIYPYHVYEHGARVATSFLDAHRVRTLPETLMIVVNRDGTIRHLEVLVFQEPKEYMAPARWYERFIGRRLDARLQLKRDIDAITGATLTARATVNAVRRVLALHQILFPPEAP